MVVVVDDNKFKNKLRFRRRASRISKLTVADDENINNHNVNGDDQRASEVIEVTESQPQLPEITNQCFDNIIKSQQDAKNYRGLVLRENGMKVMLVSDPTAERAAVCMAVEAGHMNDSLDIPGLAHLLEHVLYLGCEKYPSDGEFRKFISDT